MPLTVHAPTVQCRLLICVRRMLAKARDTLGDAAEWRARCRGSRRKPVSAALIQQRAKREKWEGVEVDGCALYRVGGVLALHGTVDRVADTYTDAARERPPSRLLGSFRKIVLLRATHTSRSPAGRSRLRELDIEFALPAFVGNLLRGHVLVGVASRTHDGAHPQRREGRPRRGQDRDNDPDDREEEAEQEEAAAASILTPRDRAGNDRADRPDDDPRHEEDACHVRRGIYSSDLTSPIVEGQKPKICATWTRFVRTVHTQIVLRGHFDRAFVDPSRESANAARYSRAPLLAPVVTMFVRRGIAVPAKTPSSTGCIARFRFFTVSSWGHVHALRLVLKYLHRYGAFFHGPVMIRPNSVSAGFPLSQ